MSYPWYEVVTGSTLQQGDILRECLEPVMPLVATDAPPATVGLEQVALSDSSQPIEPENGGIYDRVIVLTQSCDLADGKIRRVMVCPAFTVDELVKKDGGNKNNIRADLRKGRRIAYHLLNSCDLDHHETPHLVADFSDAFSIPLSYAIELAGEHQRIRLLPPYREHLAQMFARFYMRVGLPIEVTEFP